MVSSATTNNKNDDAASDYENQEIADIKNFVIDSIKGNGNAGSLYVSGMPGCGKVCNREVLVNLEFYLVFIDQMRTCSLFVLSRPLPLKCVSPRDANGQDLTLQSVMPNQESTTGRVVLSPNICTSMLRPMLAMSSHNVPLLNMAVCGAQKFSQSSQ